MIPTHHHQVSHLSQVTLTNREGEKVKKCALYYEYNTTDRRLDRNLAQLFQKLQVWQMVLKAAYDAWSLFHAIYSVYAGTSDHVEPFLTSRAFPHRTIGHALQNDLIQIIPRELTVIYSSGNVRNFRLILIFKRLDLQNDAQSENINVTPFFILFNHSSPFTAILI